MKLTEQFCLKNPQVSQEDTNVDASSGDLEGDSTLDSEACAVCDTEETPHSTRVKLTIRYL